MVWHFHIKYDVVLMRIKSSHVISLQASSERVSVNTFVYCSVCTCMFAICTYVQTCMSACGIFIHFVNSLETWANKTSSDHRECVLWVRHRIFALNFSKVKLIVDLTLAFNINEAICVSWKSHTWNMILPLTPFFLGYMGTNMF